MPKKDTGICLYCDVKFDVKEYGSSIPCPHCGGLLDITHEHEPDIILRTKEFGEIEISFCNNDTSAVSSAVSAIKNLLLFLANFLCSKK